MGARGRSWLEEKPDRRRSRDERGAGADGAERSWRGTESMGGGGLAGHPPNSPPEVPSSDIATESSMGAGIETELESDWDADLDTSTFFQPGGGRPSSTQGGEASLFESQYPWNLEEERRRMRAKQVEERPLSLAERILEAEELKRLRRAAIEERHRIKIGRSGVTKGVVQSLHARWKNAEIVRVKCEGAPAYNMKETSDLLEVRVGGGSRLSKLSHKIVGIQYALCLCIIRLRMHILYQQDTPQFVSLP